MLYQKCTERKQISCGTRNDRNLVDTSVMDIGNVQVQNVLLR